MKTDTITLAVAMDILAREIYCEDGVATAAIAEAAMRLRELHTDLANAVTCMQEQDERLKQLEAELTRLEMLEIEKQAGG